MNYDVEAEDDEEEEVAAFPSYSPLYYSQLKAKQ